MTRLARDGAIAADPVSAAANYINAVDKGLLKVMSKMGISTLRSYRSGQVFEAVGLSRELIDEYLPGTASRIGGIGLAEIAEEANARRLRPGTGARSCRTAASTVSAKTANSISGRPPRSPPSARPFRPATMRSSRSIRNSSTIRPGHLCTLRGLSIRRNQADSAR